MVVAFSRRSFGLAGVVAAAVVAAVAVLLVAGAGQVWAATGYVGSGSFGSGPGSDPGVFDGPAKAAVHDASGNVFVVDTNNDRVQVFAPDGGSAAYLTEFGAGVLDAPRGIGIDQSSGDVYVADAGNDRIVRFDSDGAPTPSFTVDVGFSSPVQGSGSAQVGGFAAALAVTPSGDLLVADPGNNRISRFDSTGAFELNFNASDAPGGAFTGLLDVAVDSTGDVLVVDSTGDVVTGGASSRVLRFTASGDFEGNLAVPTPSAVAVDPANDNVVVAGNAAAFSGARLFTFEANSLVSEVAYPGDNSGTITGLAVDGASSGRVYAVGNWVFDCCGFIGVQVLAPITLPDTSIDPPTAVTEFGAHLSGTVNPQGNQTSVEFQVSTDGTSWSTVGSPQDAGNGTSDIAVETDATDLQPGTQYRARLLATTADGATRPSPRETFTTQTVPLPDVTLGPPTEVTPTSAIFEGTVNPKGYETTYRLEYAPSWSGAPGTDGNAGSGTDDVPVSVVFDQRHEGPLQPNTQYTVRLRATNAGGSRASAEQTFTTAAAPPTVTIAVPGPVTGNTAVLGGPVNPNNSPTTYHIEYGPTTSYGNATTPADAGNGGRYRTVSTPITGLQPNTTYHYRLVATNPAGTTEGEDRTFTTTATYTPTADPPDGRRYEMVSPVDKNGYDVRRSLGTMRASTEGDAATYLGVGSFAGETQGAGLLPRYFARRGGSGWANRSIEAPSLPTASLHPFSAILGDPQNPFWFSADLRKSMVLSWRTPLASGDEAEPSIRLYQRDTAANSFRLMTRSLDGPATDWDWDKPWVTALTDDGSRALIESMKRLTPDAASTIPKVYLWDDGTPWRVDILPDGTPSDGAFSGASIPSLFSFPIRSEHVLSDDGSRAFFTTVADKRLYLRDGIGTSSARTVWVSESEHSSPEATPMPVTYRDASSDGSKVFFTTAEQLVDDDVDTVDDLYRFDVDAPEGDRLTLVSADVPSGKPVMGMLGRSDDGSRAYLAAEGTPTEGPPRPVIYLWDNGDLRHVAMVYNGGTPLFGTDDENWDQLVWKQKPSRVSSNGRFLLFRTWGPVVGFDVAGCDNESGNLGCMQFYLYDAEAEGDQALRCVSCNPSGALPGHHVRTSGTDALLNFANNEPYLPRLMVERGDGEVSIYFNSPDPLVPQDGNGRVDVYQYDTANDRVGLISGGQAEQDAFFQDASADGSDVFFVTTEQLVGWDRDGHLDVYDARIGGGFPEPPAQQPACSGDSCQGGHSGRLALAEPGSAGGSEGDADSRPRARLALTELSARQRAVLARGGRTVLKVRVNRAGRITARARARIGGRRLVVASAARTVERAGVVRLRLRLSRAARERLDRGAPLRLTLVTRFTGAPPRTMSLRLSPPVATASGPVEGR